MRIGKKPNQSRYWVKAGAKSKPKHISPEIVIGQLSPDIILSVYAPKLKEIANHMLERYADEVLLYEDTIREVQRQRQEKNNSTRNESADDDMEMEVDGTMPVTSNDSDTDPTIFIEPPRKPLFHSQFAIDEMYTTLEKASTHFFSNEGGWKSQANAAKFERLMDEKYGMFRPFVKDHPQIEEAIRILQRNYASGYFSPFRQKDPPIPKSTTVVLLFMMQRGKVRWEITLLTGLFLLVGLQPWALVLIVGLVQFLLALRKQRSVGKMKTHIPAVESYYESCTTKEEKFQKISLPVGTPAATALDETGAEYDTIIVGSGSSALYTGALLARAGRKILVLAPGEDACGCLTMQKHKNLPDNYQNIPFDVQHSNISKLTQQLQFLVPALSTQTDLQGGIRFAQIGSDADSHAFEILEVPGIGSDGSNYTAVLTADKIKETLMDEAATFLGDGWPNYDGTVGNSGLGAYIQACEQINTTSNLFYLSKILPDTINNARTKSSYEECATRYAGGLLNASFSLNTQTRSLVAALGMRVENIRPKDVSLAATVTHLCAATSGEGMHYPVGGPRALGHAFANIIERNGGKVLTEAPVKELLFEAMEEQARGKADAAQNAAQTATSDQGERIIQGQDGKEEDTNPCPRCIGVKLLDGRLIQFSKMKDGNETPAVVCMTGLIDTFIRLLPEDIRLKHNVPRGLPALSESRPVFKALFLLSGSAKDLEISGADYYRLPNASRAIDEVDPNTGIVKFGDIGWPDDPAEESLSMEEREGTITEATNICEQEDSRRNSGGKTKRKRGFKYEPGYSWINISFPSAKDPSFEERYGAVTTCVVTFEVDDDFVTHLDSKPKLYISKGGGMSLLDRLLFQVKRDLLDLYPQLQDRVIHAELPNFLVRSLAHNPERFAAKGVRADTIYPGLFVGGSDLTVHGSFSAGIVGGWLAANAVTGYNFVDLLFLEKNITSDISQFLEVPVETGEDDVAVPWTPSPPVNEDDEKSKQE